MLGDTLPLLIKKLDKLQNHSAQMPNISENISRIRQLIQQARNAASKVRPLHNMSHNTSKTWLVLDVVLLWLLHFSWVYVFMMMPLLFYLVTVWCWPLFCVRFNLSKWHKQYSSTPSLNPLLPPLPSRPGERASEVQRFVRSPGSKPGQPGRPGSLHQPEVLHHAARKDPRQTAGRTQQAVCLLSRKQGREYQGFSS